mmetsp:Transcript_10177/g.31388  ORF Transcript_10177/g.31388 Transcript_10177/m.31388 type:complete len:236 (+) Transcript_10177:386-1093(+)
MRRVALCAAALCARAAALEPTRRRWCAGAASTLFAPAAARADLAPGFAVVDAVNLKSNPDASPSRDPLNKNVLFGQDFYFKFGRAPPFLADADAPLPDNGAVPFTRVQQRYEAYGKYGARVLSGVEAFKSLRGAIDAGAWSVAADDDAKYALRAMGLLANGLMASENAGPGNVLFLTRWYVNEVALDIGDIAKATDKAEAKRSWERGRKALNSALVVINKEINPKVGEPFALVNK